MTAPTTMDTKQRVTQKDIAHLLGLNRSTVSLALRGAPSIPETTRHRIAKAAKQIGYAPDPMLSALATYRHRTRRPTFCGTVAWLTHASTKGTPVAPSPPDEILEGARARALHHGFRLEVFAVSSWSRTAQICQARGIQAVLVSPQLTQPTGVVLPEWNWCSIVTFGYRTGERTFHSVSAAHYRAMARTVHELHARGPRRIGCVFQPGLDDDVEYNLLAGYSCTSQRLTLTPVPVLTLRSEANASAAMEAWLQQTRADALIVSDLALATFAQGMRAFHSARISLACPTLPHARPGIAGVIEHKRLIGEVACDQVIAMTKRSERGAPEHPQSILIEGQWSEGGERPCASPSPTSP